MGQRRRSTGWSFRAIKPRLSSESTTRTIATGSVAATRSSGTKSALCGLRVCLDTSLQKWFYINYSRHRYPLPLETSIVDAGCWQTCMRL